jgi:uncharacterized membrane protein YfcA
VITDPVFFLIAVPALVFLGLAKGGFAGLGSIATPLVALYLPPLEAAALILPILLCQDAISSWIYRREWDAWNLRVMLPGAAIGIALAWLFADFVSDDMIRVTVGLIGIAFVLNAFLNRGLTEPQTKTAAGGVFWGATSGFVSTLTQGGSPPFQIHVLPQRLPKMTLVGTTTLFFAAVNVMKVAPYFALGQFSGRNLVTSAVLLPVAVATNFLGVWLVRRTPMEAFYRIAYVLAFLVSSALIIQGGTNLAHG